MPHPRPAASPDLIRRYQEGATLGQLAAIQGVSPQTIRRMLTDAGEPILPNGRVATGRAIRARHGYDDAPLAEWSAAGLTCAEIAEILGRDEESVRKAMVLRGIPRQPPKARPERNVFWRGGYAVDDEGYILVRQPDHPDAPASGYVRQHRLVVEQSLGRRLLPTEVVDHRNGDTSDNTPGNLRLFPSNAEHLRATLTGVAKIPAAERERLRQSAVLRARRRVAAILAGSVADAGPLPSAAPRRP